MLLLGAVALAQEHGQKPTFACCIISCSHMHWSGQQNWFISPQFMRFLHRTCFRFGMFSHNFSRSYTFAAAYVKTICIARSIITSFKFSWHSPFKVKWCDPTIIVLSSCTCEVLAALWIQWIVARARGGCLFYHQRVCASLGQMRSSLPPLSGGWAMLSSMV